jgi:hypothetical protein
MLLRMALRCIRGVMCRKGGRWCKPQELCLRLELLVRTHFWSSCLDCVKFTFEFDLYKSLQ